MKRLYILSLLAFAVFALFTVVTAVSPVSYGSNGKWFAPPWDFSLRMTEIDCLKKGVNPFDVWHGDVVLPPYLPNYESKVSGPEFTEPINAYAPWEYALMMPLSFLSREVAWATYFGIMMACLFVVAFLGGRRHPLLAFLPLLGVAYPIWSNACIGNFSIIVLAAVVCMAWSLERRHDVLAGVCWAIAMLKPQLGIIFALPILMRKRFLTAFVAGGICVALSVIPAVLCHVSPVTLIAQTPAANAFCFTGCGTWPYALCGIFGQNAEILLALALGAVCCIVGTALLPKDVDWAVYLMPAAVCAMSWTYASTYGHVMGWFLFAVILAQLIREPRSRFFRILLVLSCLSAMRWVSVYRAFAFLFAGRWPQLAISDETYLHIDTLASMADMLIMLALCRGISIRGIK